MKRRTKKFAIDICRFTDTMPAGRSTGIIVRQLIRSATSVGANYRAALRGKSTPDFIAKLGIVLEEIDESLYWLEMLDELEKTHQKETQLLLQEAKELTAIIASSLKTSKANLRQGTVPNLKS